MEVKLVFAWYDFWLGMFFDRKSGWLYFMVPMIGIKVRR